MSRIKTAFSYYGGKSKIAHLYSPPMHDVIIEPFAGSAGYSQLYWANKVFLLDVDVDVIETWRYLIEATPEDILALPDVDIDTDVADLDIPYGARNLIGYWINEGSSVPKRTPGYRCFWNDKKVLLAAVVNRFSHWEVFCASYDVLAEFSADVTWFIDPPYMSGGEYYRHSKINYDQLTNFCMTRDGQVIVCENSEANWLLFRKLKDIQGSFHKSTEVVFERESSSARKMLMDTLTVKRIRKVMSDVD